VALMLFSVTATGSLHPSGWIQTGIVGQCIADATHTRRHEKAVECSFDHLV